MDKKAYIKKTAYPGRSLSSWSSVESSIKSCMLALCLLTFSFHAEANFPKETKAQQEEIHSPSVTDDWSGLLDLKMGSKLPLTLSIEQQDDSGVLYATLVFVDWGEAVPIETIAFDGKAISFDIPNTFREDLMGS